MLAATDDTALLSLFQNKATRDQGFKGILNKYGQHIYYFLRGMGLGHNDADELLQDVFIQLWRVPAGDEPGSSVKNSLYHLAVTNYLALKTEAPLKGLSIEQSLIIVLKEQEQFDFADIAQIISIPVEEVRSLFKTGISKLS
ncbi:hypothetical protein SNE25_12935 [Mucilaginibacter sabulilitoris]|uniref:RNA polymerase sigma-70 region 2 domain-containing protein n=1 Tax=Mucilaginibacter sabulilitoris TaxID=1173583 RepID=A0ABZ0TY78_9SPHI|nr:hypothetical protein [Mucilaginibacter sabulilitoris]WPU96425.1 hypothetical protein SNE25_12935 [Mucilaginibacter sabulilitoris]